jgi:hypothetical protein
MMNQAQFDELVEMLTANNQALLNAVLEKIQRTNATPGTLIPLPHVEEEKPAPEHGSHGGF